MESDLVYPFLDVTHLTENNKNVTINGENHPQSSNEDVTTPSTPQQISHCFLFLDSAQQFTKRKNINGIIDKKSLSSEEEKGNRETVITKATNVFIESDKEKNNSKGSLKRIKNARWNTQSSKKLRHLSSLCRRNVTNRDMSLENAASFGYESNSHHKSSQTETFGEEDEEEEYEDKTTHSCGHIMLRDFKPKFYSISSEAHKGNMDGSHLMVVNAPGMPKKKFCTKDLNKVPAKKTQWPVQAIYDTGYEDSKMVLYEGWSSDTSSIIPSNELKLTANLMYQRCILRNKILHAVKCHSKEKNEKKKNINSRDSSSPFWCYEDLSYFHSLENQKCNWAPIFYAIPDGLSAASAIKVFPTLTYVTTNLLTDKVLKSLKENPMAISIDVFMKKSKTDTSININKDNVVNSCISEYCKCDIRYKYIYGDIHIQRIRYNDRSALQLNNYVMGTPRFVIECSDSCLCDISCPNRRSQRGQQVPLVVYYEGFLKNFGVRAGQTIYVGEFIAEYQGVVCQKEEIDCETYLMDITTVNEDVAIDSSKIGNIGRYINHSCDPNAIFTEIHSRKSESDILVPKVGVFALKQIEMGEEISASYYTQQELLKASVRKSRRTACHCKSRKCKGWLPTKY